MSNDRRQTPDSTGREQFNSRLKDDQAAAVHDFMQTQGTSKAEATRQLVAKGLQSEGYLGGDDNKDGDHDGDGEWLLIPIIIFPLVLLCVIMILLGYFGPEIINDIRDMTGLFASLV